MNSIFNFKNKMTHKARNHLYDNIDEEIAQEQEFTEADLVQQRNRSRGSQRSIEEDVVPTSSPARLPR